MNNLINQKDIIIFELNNKEFYTPNVENPKNYISDFFKEYSKKHNLKNDVLQWLTQNQSVPIELNEECLVVTEYVTKDRKHIYTLNTIFKKDKGWIWKNLVSRLKPVVSASYRVISQLEQYEHSFDIKLFEETLPTSSPTTQLPNIPVISTPHVLPPTNSNVTYTNTLYQFNSKDKHIYNCNYTTTAIQEKWDGLIQKRVGIDIGKVLRNINTTHTKAIVAGGFILQNILHENWKNSDIDIFTTEIDAISKAIAPGLHISRWKKLKGKYLKKYTKNESIDGSTSPSPSPNEYKSNSKNGIIDVYEGISLYGLRIQLIHTTDIEKSLAQFDCSALINYYDGHNVYVDDHVSVYNKEMFITNMSEERKKKYRDRGFTIIDDDKRRRNYILSPYSLKYVINFMPRL